MADEDAQVIEEPLAQWAEVQKRTFTRWMNVHLVNRGIKVDNLSQDLQDGLVLINVLEQISGQKIPKYHKTVKMRIHKTENVAAALDFMKAQGLKLTNIGATDIVDKKTKLILGVVWTIILRYQIQKIEHSGESGGSANAELLAWINKAIPSYKIRNFTTDWKDGKAISALVDYLKPGVIDLTLLNTNEPKENASIAIHAADVHLQIPPIMEAADMVIEEPDDLSIMTYVSYFRDYDRKHKDASAAHSYAEGPGLQGGVIGDDNPFNVFPLNSFGGPARLEGSPFEVKVRGPDGSENKDVSVEIHKNDDNTFLVNYILPENIAEGNYKIDVKLQGAPIKDSPFEVEFYKVDPEVLAFAKQTTVDFSGLDKDSTPDGDKVFTVIPNGPVPNGSHYEVNIKNPDGDVIPASLVHKDDGTYDVKFYPTKDGKHNIAVNLLDQNNKAARTKGSPFHPIVSQSHYNYPRVVFPTYPSLGQHAKIVDSDKQPHSVKHVLSNLPSGWKFHIEIKLKDPSGALHDIEGSPFELEKPQK